MRQVFTIILSDQFVHNNVNKLSEIKHDAIVMLNFVDLKLLHHISKECIRYIS